jgi:hypothetical protein
MSNATPADPGPPEAHPGRLQLDLVRLIASTAGAVLAAVVLSRFGVAGTISGAALGSLIASIGTEVNQHYLSRSSQRLRQLRAARRAGGPAGPAPDRPGRRLPGWLHWKALAALGAAGFLVAMLMITGFELAAGRPLAGVVGSHRADDGGSTTVGELTGGGGTDQGSRTPAPSVDSDTTSATTAPGAPQPTTSTRPTSSTAPGVAPSTAPGATGGVRRSSTTTPAAPGG